MSIQRIDIPESRTHGWQARAHVTADQRLTKFFSDSAHGGYVTAYLLADEHEPKLIAEAQRLRKIHERASR